MKLKHVYLASAFASVLMVSACSKDDSNTDQPTVNGQDTTFMIQASRSNRAEIELGGLAKTKGTNDSVKMFAQTMISDHQMAQTNLTNLADSVNATVNLNDSLDADQIAMRNVLSSLSGAAFDSAYIAGQVVAHQKTLSIFNAEISGGQNAQVKNFATRTQPVIQSHLNLADSILMHLQ